MSKQRHLYVDIHVLQTVPPSCVNRDDTGSPKTAVYGGVRRARVSSQAWKHAVRMMFREMYEPEDYGYRTQRVVHLVQTRIEEKNPGLDAQDAAIRVLTDAGLTIKKIDKISENGVEALFFMSDAQAEALSEIAVHGPQGEKERKIACVQAIKEHPSIDQILFGRMVASDPSLNYDAAAQVAHAISTHGVQNEFDYFTAGDDLSPEDTAGAGHLGTVEFNSSTLYRYATVNVTELSASLGSASPSAVRNFIEAFVCSMPTGKQNTFANRTKPDVVYVTVRKDQPVNLVGAFEKPVQVDRTGGYADASVQRLMEYAKKVYANYTDAPAKSWAMGISVADTEALPLPKLLEAVEACLAQEVHEG